MRRRAASQLRPTLTVDLTLPLPYCLSCCRPAVRPRHHSMHGVPRWHTAQHGARECVRALVSARLSGSCACVHLRPCAKSLPTCHCSLSTPSLALLRPAVTLATTRQRAPPTAPPAPSTSTRPSQAQVCCARFGCLDCIARWCLLCWRALCSKGEPASAGHARPEPCLAECTLPPAAAARSDGDQKCWSCPVGSVAKDATDAVGLTASITCTVW